MKKDYGLSLSSLILIIKILSLLMMWEGHSKEEENHYPLLKLILCLKKSA
jgi:hypothetical protein